MLRYTSLERDWLIDWLLVFNAQSTMTVISGRLERDILYHVYEQSWFPLSECLVFNVVIKIISWVATYIFIAAFIWVFWQKMLCELDIMWHMLRLVRYVWCFSIWYINYNIIVDLQPNFSSFINDCCDSVEKLVTSMCNKMKYFSNLCSQISTMLWKKFSEISIPIH